MTKRKLLLVATALTGMAATSASADAQGYGYGYGHSYHLHHHGYSRFTGRNPNYLGPLGLSKQTATGGPVGGSTLGTGGR